jgi:hypothetical protein
MIAMTETTTETITSGEGLAEKPWPRAFRGLFFRRQSALLQASGRAALT